MHKPCWDRTFAWLLQTPGGGLRQKFCPESLNHSSPRKKLAKAPVSASQPFTASFSNIEDGLMFIARSAKARSFASTFQLLNRASKRRQVAPPRKRCVSEQKPFSWLKMKTRCAWSYAMSLSDTDTKSSRQPQA